MEPRTLVHTPGSVPGLAPGDTGPLGDRVFNVWPAEDGTMIPYAIASGNGLRFSSPVAVTR
jgi:hypothetical protein